MHTLETLLEHIKTRLEPECKKQLYKEKKGYIIKFFISGLITALLFKISLLAPHCNTQPLFIISLITGIISLAYLWAFFKTKYNPDALSFSADSNLNKDEMGMLLDMDLSETSIDILQVFMANEWDINQSTIQYMIEQNARLEKLKEAHSHLQMQGFNTQKQQENLHKILTAKPSVFEMPDY